MLDCESLGMALRNRYSSVTATSATELPSREPLPYALAVLELIALQGVDLLGIVGNMTIIVVLRHRGMRKGGSNMLFTSLAVADLLYSLAALIGDTLSLVSKMDERPFQGTSQFSGVCYIDALEKTVLGVGATIASAVAIECCIAVLFPLKAARIVTPTRVKILIGCLVLYVLCVCSLLPFACHTPRTANGTWHVDTSCRRQFDWCGSPGLTPRLGPHLVGTVNAIIILVCHLTIGAQLTYHVHNKHTLTIRTVTTDIKMIKAHVIVYVIYVSLFAFLLIRDSFLLMEKWRSVFVLSLRAAVSWKLIIFLILSRKFYSTFKKQFVVK